MIRPAALALAICVPIVVTQVLTPLLIAVARRLDLYDAPDGGRRVHSVAVPRVGGVAVICGVAAALVALGDTIGADRGMTGIMAGASIVALVGLVDDLRGVSPRLKVLGQVVAALVAWGFAPIGGALAIGYGGAEIPLGPLAPLLLVLWVVIVSNGYNLIDGINGLATSVGMVGAASAAIIAWLLGNGNDALVALALFASLAGFLRFNFPNARIFMGDSGSLTIGFLLALLTVRGATRPSGAVIAVVPLLALLVPLFETGLTIVRRWLRSVPVVAADAHHIHHRLLAMGFAHRDATLVLASVATLFATLGIGLGVAGPEVTWIIALLVIGALLVALLLAASILSYHEISVAGSVLATAPARVRRVIRDQIAATDLLRQVAGARSLADLKTLVEGQSANFGFARMVLQVAGEERAPADPPGRIWRLDYPLEAPAGLPPFVGFSLTVLCPAGAGSRPFGAERVVHLLAPALEQWLAANVDLVRAEIAAAAPAAPAQRVAPPDDGGIAIGGATVRRPTPVP